MPANFEGRRAVVTGASSGIERAIALELARHGADVAVHYARSEQRAREVVNEISALGRQAISLQADLSDVDHAEFVSRCWNDFGPVDIWVNNAGVDLLTGDGPSYSFEEKLRLLLAIDVTGTVLLSRMVGQRMKRQRELDEDNAPASPCILNIGWDQADRGMEGDSAELFSTAKNAVMGFTRSLAVSLAPHVRVNCIAPGWIRTAWGDDAPDAWQDRVIRETPLKRWGMPEDIARLATFLVSPNAEYLTGQIINANGGAIR
ncbi:MAG: SDR family oxidoreductase [Planctomycetaceae bacterium]|nr:SDR family oxidoreductase [Planctomycetaceae bacterium]